jgi:hypothetical protein
MSFSPQATRITYFWIWVCNGLAVGDSLTSKRRAEALHKFDILIVL